MRFKDPITETPLSCELIFYWKKIQEKGKKVSCVLPFNSPQDTVKKLWDFKHYCSIHPFEINSKPVYISFAAVVLEINPVYIKPGDLIWVAKRALM